MNKKMNLVMLADSYKYSHAKQYPDDMVSMYDYMEARSSKVYPATIFVGLQGLIKNYLLEPVTIQDVNQAYAFATAHGVPFDLEGWEYIVEKLGGKLPVRIKAVKEGSLIPVKMVLMTIESTDMKVPWIAGWLETLLMKLWYPTNIATKAYYTRKILEKYGSPEWAQFAYHNFGDRGSSSVESAAIGGFAHSTQFMGTDNFNSLLYSFENYGSLMAAYSVFATEHSTTTSHGRQGEHDFVMRKLLENPDAPIMSFVADSYDVFTFTDMVTNPGSEIRKLIESRPNQKFVLRPDSGEPLGVLDQMFRIMEENGVFDIEINGKKASSNFGVLWGDGITPVMIEGILIMISDMGYAAENMVFGSGGDLMQNHTRDTMGFAVKCSSITVYESDNATSCMYDIDVFKDPITDPGKKSKKGKVTTYYNRATDIYFVDQVGTEFDNSTVDILETVYENGKLIIEVTHDEVRAASI